MAALLVTALTLGACGRKGPLEHPPNAKTVNADGTVETVRRNDDRPFILDRLLR